MTVTDSMTLRVDSAAWSRSARGLHDSVDRGSHEGVRESGKRFGEEAGKRAPRLSETLSRSMGPLGEPRRKADGTWAVSVGARPGFRNPRGAEARLYAGKAEEHTRFMSDARRAVVSEVRNIQIRAWSRAIERGA